MSKPLQAHEFNSFGTNQKAGNENILTQVHDLDL